MPQIRVQRCSLLWLAGESQEHVITLFRRVRRAVCIDCPAGEPRPLRLHDLRHTAAVHRVLAWYRSGKDRFSMRISCRAALPALIVTGTNPPSLVGGAAKRSSLCEVRTAAPQRTCSITQRRTRLAFGPLARATVSSPILACSSRTRCSASWAWL